MQPRILVVDDEPAMCRLLKTMLDNAGMDTCYQTDTERALIQMQEEKFDAVFMDVNMPGHTGVELTRRIRSCGFNQRTPIVMMTGYSEPKTLRSAFEAGTNYFLFKPIDNQKLMRLLRASIGAIQQERRRFQRVPVSLRVVAECGHQRLEGKALDLSLGGILLKATAAIPEGNRLQLRIHLAPGNQLCVTGTVARLLPDGGMGIQFHGLDASDSEKLQDFLLPHFLN